MEIVLSRLATMGPTVAVLLAVAGLAFGLFGWRLVRLLTLADASVVAIAAGAVIGQGPHGYVFDWLPWLVCPLLAISMCWMAWRHRRAALAVAGGTTWFFLLQWLLDGLEVPLLPRALLGIVAGGMALAMHLAVYREAAVITTGLHGGWLCLAALIATSADPRSFGSTLVHALNSHALLLPLAGILVSVILIALQWSDMERSAEAAVE